MFNLIKCKVIQVEVAIVILIKVIQIICEDQKANNMIVLIKMKLTGVYQKTLEMQLIKHNRNIKKLERASFIINLKN